MIHACSSFELPSSYNIGWLEHVFPRSRCHTILRSLSRKWASYWVIDKHSTRWGVEITFVSWKFVDSNDTDGRPCMRYLDKVKWLELQKNKLAQEADLYRRNTCFIGLIWTPNILYLPLFVHIGPLVFGDTSPRFADAKAATKLSCNEQSNIEIRVTPFFKSPLVLPFRSLFLLLSSSFSQTASTPVLCCQSLSTNLIYSCWSDVPETTWPHQGLHR